MKSTTLKGAAYLRTNATGDERQGILDSQLARIRKTAAKDGIELVHTYSDTCSGLNTAERFERVLSAAKAGEFSVLYCDRFDRLSRALPDAIGFATVLDKHGVALRCVSDNLDTARPNGKLMLSLLESLSVFWENVQKTG